jgi:hypothetical protein
MCPLFPLFGHRYIQPVCKKVWKLKILLKLFLLSSRNPLYLFIYYCNLKTCKMSQNLLLILDIVLQMYLAEAQELTFIENLVLQTLDFNVSVEYADAHIVRWFCLVRGECVAVNTGRWSRCRLHMFIWQRYLKSWIILLLFWTSSCGIICRLAYTATMIGVTKYSKTWL